jgi:nuclear pore complex protein Nup205
LQVADDLDLDELDAARICLEAQPDSKTSSRSLNICSILRFHQQRKYLLDCLRLILQLADDVGGSNHALVEGFRSVIAEVVQAQDPSNNSTKYVTRCLTSMSDIKAWLQKLMDRLSGASVIGKEWQPELEEVVEYQRVSLVGQHETLSIIVLYLVKMDYSSVSNFELVLERLRTADKYDHFLRKYNHDLSPATSKEYQPY